MEELFRSLRTNWGKLYTYFGERKLTEVERLRKRGVKMGENCHVFNSMIDYGHGFLVEVGNNVTITHATILAHDASMKKELGYAKVGKVIIGDNVFIGYGSIILPDCRIGNKVIIGAGTVVTHDVPDNSVVVGNPARIISTYDEFMEKHKAEMQIRPVFTTSWREKSDTERQNMSEMLETTWGYDL